MKLSDLGSSAASGDVGGPGGAPAGFPTSQLDSVAAGPSSAIAAGSSFFDNAYQQAGGSITGTVAVAASIVSDLPAGPAKQLLSQVLGIASGAMAGAAIGSVIPGWGTAVGAAVGAIIGAVSVIVGGGGPQPPEGDLRSNAEQFVFPPDPTAVDGPTDPESLLEQQTAQPVSFPQIRQWSAGFQVPIYPNTDPGTGQGTPAGFTFGTSWVSPPGTTPQTKKAAWYLAQAWIGRDIITNTFALGLKSSAADPSLLADGVSAAREQAGTVLGSDVLVGRAMRLLSRWYGTDFTPRMLIAAVSPVDFQQQLASGQVAKHDGKWFWPVAGFSASFCPGVNPNFGVTFQTASQSWQEAARTWQRFAQCMNRRNALDYIYYFSETLAIEQIETNHITGSVITGVTQVGTPLSLPSATSGAGVFFAAMPDTTIVGLAELACLVVSGLIPLHGSDEVALHYVLSLAWLWRRGQELDKLAGLPFAISNHDNFSRLIGLLAHRVQKTKRAAATVAAKKRTAKKPSKQVARTKLEAAQQRTNVQLEQQDALAIADAAKLRAQNQTRNALAVRSALAMAPRPPAPTAGHTWAFVVFGGVAAAGALVILWRVRS